MEIAAKLTQNVCCHGWVKKHNSRLPKTAFNRIFFYFFIQLKNIRFASCTMRLYNRRTVSVNCVKPLNSRLYLY